MSAPQPIASPEPLARRICQAVFKERGERNLWLEVATVAKRLREKDHDALNAALDYGRKKRWLLTASPPVHSVLLTHEGIEMGRAGMKQPRAVEPVDAGEQE